MKESGYRLSYKAFVVVFIFGLLQGSFLTAPSEISAIGGDDSWKVEYSEDDLKNLIIDYHTLVQSMVQSRLKDSGMETTLWGNQYCHQSSSSRVCSGCWSAFGGEGGRIDCAARLGVGNVYYGSCDEPRNRRHCN